MPINSSGHHVQMAPFKATFNPAPFSASPTSVQGPSRCLVRERSRPLRPLEFSAERNYLLGIMAVWTRAFSRTGVQFPDLMNTRRLLIFPRLALISSFHLVFFRRGELGTLRLHLRRRPKIIHLAE